jgi:hypothetical protein
MQRATWLVLAALFGSPAFSETSPICSILPDTTACALTPRFDADGILVPGLHAYFGSPRSGYDHGILGQHAEWGALTMILQGSAGHGPLYFATADLPPDRIFEDIAPRSADLNGDGGPELVVVETDIQRGAQLAVYASDGNRLFKLAATSFIGQKHRWLAPAGIADFDGDGLVEIAYVDRPHLLKELVFVRLEGDRLVETARLPGLTNHRIGDDYISGGVRDCGSGAELILASPDWTRVLLVRRGVVTDVGPMPAGKLTVPGC